MSRTLDDLRTTLQVYGDQLPPSSARTLGVHKHIRRIRRQRFVAAAAVVTLVAGVGAAAAAYGKHTSSATASAAQAPAYYLGGRLIAELNIDSKVRDSASTTVTPNTTSLTFYSASCGPDDIGDIGVEFTVGGVYIGGDTCGGAAESPVQVGVPLLVTFRLVHVNGARTTAVTDAERASLRGIRTVGGVYAPVPRAEYPFPPQPTPLPTLPPATGQFGTSTHELSGSGSGSRTITVGTSRGLILLQETVAPGVLTLLLDGKVVETFPTWDYADRQLQFKPTGGELPASGGSAQLTVRWNGFPVGTPTWRVQVLNAGDYRCGCS